MKRNLNIAFVVPLSPLHNCVLSLFVFGVRILDKNSESRPTPSPWCSACSDSGWVRGVWSFSVVLKSFSVGLKPTSGAGFSAGKRPQIALFGRNHFRAFEGRANQGPFAIQFPGRMGIYEWVPHVFHPGVPGIARQISLLLVVNGSAIDEVGGLAADALGA